MEKINDEGKSSSPFHRSSLLQELNAKIKPAVRGVKVNVSVKTNVPEGIGFS